MFEHLIDHESAVRYYALLAAFGAIACWEAYAPRVRIEAHLPRWRTAIVLIAIGAACVQLVFPVLLVGFAAICAANGIGALHLVDWPFAVEFMIAFVLLDLSRYVEHRVLHQLPWLWRLHQVHHSDPDYDVSTALRFHPVEMLVTVPMHLIAIALIGVSPIVALAYEVVFVAQSAWAHANVGIPARLDRALRTALVTPSLHSIHHSRERVDANLNFGAISNLWDRIFGTFAHDSRAAQPLRFGLPTVEASRAQDIGWLLALPFRRASRDPYSAQPVPQLSDRARAAR